MTGSIPAKSAVLPGEFVNLGDAMLSLAAARRLSRDGGQVTVLPYRRPSEEVRSEFEKEGFEVIAMRDEPLRALRACGSGSIWIGGGHAIRNEISLGWLLFTTVVAWLAKASGRTVRVIGSGATPIASGWRHRLFGRILACCDRICVRDPLSAKALRADFPAVADRVERAGDLAFLDGCVHLPAGHPETSACLVSPGIDVQEGRVEDPSEILKVLRDLFERCGMKHVIVVSHDSRTELGLDFCRSFAAAVQEAMPVTVEVAAQGGIEHGLLQPYGRARWIVTGRLHGLIIGALLRRSVIYTRGSASKLRPFAQLFDYQPAGATGGDPFHARGDTIAQALARQRVAAETNFSG